MLPGFSKTGRQAVRSLPAALGLKSLLLPPCQPLSSPCPRPCCPSPWPLGLFFTLRSLGIKHQSHNCTVIYMLPCKGPYLLRGHCPSLLRAVGWLDLRLCLQAPFPVSPPFSWTSERSRLRQSPSATCSLPPRHTPVQTYVQQPVLTCLPVSAREFLLPAKVTSCPSGGSWPPGL